MAPTEDSSNRGRAQPWTGGRDRPRRPVGTEPADGQLRTATEPLRWAVDTAVPPRGATTPGPRTGEGSRAAERSRTGETSRTGERSRTSTEAPVPGQRRRRAPEGPAGGPPSAGRRKRKPQKSRKKKVLLWTGGTMAVVLVAGAAGAYALYNKFNGNLNTVDVGDAASGGETMEGPLNILIIGNDIRTGEGNTSYGNKDNVTGHADTTFLFHVSEDRTNATAISIPGTSRPRSRTARRSSPTVRPRSSPARRPRRSSTSRSASTAVTRAARCAPSRRCRAASRSTTS